MTLPQIHEQSRIHFNKSITLLREYYNILGTDMWDELSKLTPDERLELYKDVLDTNILNNECSMNYIQKTINNILNILVN